METLQSPAPPAVATSSLPGPPGAEPARLAGFWRRVAASVIDGLVLSVLSLLLVVPLLFGTGMLREGPGYGAVLAIMAMYLGVWFLQWLYFALQHSSAHQATVGKRAFGIKVVSLQGERIGLGLATGRWFGSLLSSMVFGIGYLMAAFTVRRQALHDLLASTLVVSRNTTPADIATGLAPPRVSGGVIATVVILCVLPFVLGVAAAIAIPAYQDYLIRTQVAAGLDAAGAYKAAVTEALANGAEHGTLDNEALDLPAEDASPHVSSIEVAAGAIQITYGGDAHQRLAEQTLTLVPGRTADDEIVWTCGRAAVPDGVTPTLRAHAQYTTVEDRYLPTSCR